MMVSELAEVRAVTQLEKSPVSVSQPGELVIRVHLPIIFSKVNG
ncbi:MAG: hypothetical protein ACYTXY_08805 [Nostoc sp.]